MKVKHHFKKHWRVDEIINSQIVGVRSLEDTRVVKSSLLETLRNNRTSSGNDNKITKRELRKDCQTFFKTYSLSTWSSFLESFIISRRAQDVRSLSLFVLEPLHNLHLKISKLLRMYTVNYWSVDIPRAGQGQRGRKAFAKMWACVFWGCILLLNAPKKVRSCQ